MIKHFCDYCGTEITESNNGFELSASRKNCDKRSMTVWATSNPDGDGEEEYCKYCIIDTLNILDDRPRAG